MTFTYVEMSCPLNPEGYDEGLPQEGISVDSISKFAIDSLFDCYTQAFSQGEAIFYQRQDAAERRRYFDEELGIPDVLQHPASFAYVDNDELIGFSLVMDYLVRNYHISCMCLQPAYQSRGLGRAMLNRIKNIALKNGCRTLSLGTEPTMKAYRLYSTHGFEVTAEHQVDL